MLNMLSPKDLEKINDIVNNMMNHQKLGASNFDEIVCNAANSVEICCPNNSEHHICKNGKDRHGRQRYICKGCGTTFFAVQNSLTSGINQNTSIWMNFIHGLFKQHSLEEASERCGISIPTALSWRLRVFQALDKIMADIKLGGTIVADDTRVDYNLKGNHNQAFVFPRKEKHRGSTNNIHNYQKNSICILCAIDEENHSFSRIIGFGTPSGKRITDGFKNKIDDSQKSILITDGAKYFKDAVNSYNLTEWKRKVTTKRGNKKIPDTKDNFHIQRINAYHSRLKSFLHKYKGVSSRYLPGYLLLFDFIQNNKGVDENYLCKQILYTMALLPQLTINELEEIYCIPVSNGPEKELWEVKIPLVEQKIYKDKVNGMSTKELEKKYKIHRRKIYSISEKVSKYGVHSKIMQSNLNKHNKMQPIKPISERNWNVFLFHYRDGHTVVETAKKFGMSRQNVYNIINSLLHHPETQKIKKYTPPLSPKQKKRITCPKNEIQERNEHIYLEFSFLKSEFKKEKTILEFLSQKYGKTPKVIYNNIILPMKQKDITAEFKYKWQYERNNLSQIDYYKYLQDRNRTIVEKIENYSKTGNFCSRKDIFKYLSQNYKISPSHIERIYYYQSYYLYIYDNYAKSLKQQELTLEQAQSRSI